MQKARIISWHFLCYKAFFLNRGLFGECQQCTFSRLQSVFSLMGSGTYALSPFSERNHSLLTMWCDCLSWQGAKAFYLHEELGSGLQTLQYKKTCLKCSLQYGNINGSDFLQIVFICRPKLQNLTQSILVTQNRWEFYIKCQSVVFFLQSYELPILLIFLIVRKLICAKAPFVQQKIVTGWTLYFWQVFTSLNNMVIWHTDVYYSTSISVHVSSVAFTTVPAWNSIFSLTVSVLSLVDEILALYKLIFICKAHTSLYAARTAIRPKLCCNNSFYVSGVSLRLH